MYWGWAEWAGPSRGHLTLQILLLLHWPGCQMWSSRLRSGEITPDRAHSADLTTTSTGCQGRKSIALTPGRHSSRGLNRASNYLWDTE